MANRIYQDPTQPGRFELEQDGLPAVSIRYNEQTHSLRLQSGNEQRVFMIERHPFSERLRLFSEYGIPTGTCHIEGRTPLRGSLRVEGVRMRFQSNNGELELRVDGKTIDRFAWPPGSYSPEALAGVLMLVGRQEITTNRVAP